MGSNLALTAHSGVLWWRGQQFYLPCVAQSDTRVVTHSWNSLNSFHIVLGWTQFPLQVTCNWLEKLQLLKKKKDLDSEIRVYFEKKLLIFYRKRFPRPVNLTHQPLSPHLQNFHRYFIM